MENIFWDWLSNIPEDYRGITLFAAFAMVGALLGQLAGWCLEKIFKGVSFKDKMIFFGMLCGIALKNMIIGA